MGDNLWNLEETDAGEKRVLSRKEREFLRSGDPGTYTTAKMERRVESKVEKLPDRIQQLVDDVCLLYYRGYLDSQANSEMRDHLFSITNRSQAVRDSPVITPSALDSEDAADLGFEFGSLLRMLHDESVPTDLAWGMIVGLVGESSENWETEAGNLVELFERLEEHYERRLFSAGAEAHQDDGFSEERAQIREILKQQGFAPTPSLVTAVLLEDTTNDSSELLDKGEKSWRADPEQTDHPTPPDEVPSESEMQRTRFESIIQKVENQTELRAVDRLAKDLREDAIRIQRRQWRGVDPDKAIRFIGRNGETQLQEFEQTETKGTNNMTTALRQLSYDDSSWVNRPVLRENQGENSYWEFTPYGKLLHSVRIEHNCSTNWIYNYVVDPEGLDGGFKQLVSKVLNKA